MAARAPGAVMWLCMPGHDRGVMLPSPARWHRVHCGVGHEHHSSMEAILSEFLPCQRMSAAPCEFHEGQVCPHRFRPLARSFRAQPRITAVALEDPGLTAVTQTDVEDLPQPLFETGGGYRRHHFHTPGEITEHPVGRANVKFPIERIFVASGEMEDP